VDTNFTNQREFRSEFSAFELVAIREMGVRRGVLHQKLSPNQKKLKKVLQ
jgi:hypothetical protein